MILLRYNRNTLMEAIVMEAAAAPILAVILNVDVF